MGNIIIIVAVIAAGIVALLIVAVVVILICRRQRKPTDKYHNGHLNKSSPDSGYPGENGDLNNGFYENLPFHGMKQQPHKQIQFPKMEFSQIRWVQLHPLHPSNGGPT